MLFETTRFADFMRWVGTPPKPSEIGLRARMRVMFQPIAAYVLAVLRVTQVFSVILVNLLLVLPDFGLFSPVAIVDGLVNRDLRRWGEGRESSLLYHWDKRSALPLLVLTWVTRLALPFSPH